jgi:transcriptional regulator with XRE-family HTH domain
MMNVSSIGQRIYELRTERLPRLTQQELAERAGLGVDLIQKLEQGRKSSARITSLMAIAQALDVDLSDLLGKRTILESVPEHGGLLELRRAITPVNDATTEKSAIDDLPEKISDAWRLYWKGDFDALAAMLPCVIWDARTVGDGDQLADALCAAGVVLVQLSRTDLAYTAMIAALEAANDPLLRSSVVGWLAWVLLNQGRPGDGTTLALREVEAVQPGLLLRLERVAPGWIGYQVFPRGIVAELKASRYQSSRLDRLASRLGVS